MRDRLRNATGEAHDAIEALPFQEAVRSHGLPPEGYREYLGALLPLRRALEGELRAARDPRIAGLWSDEMARAPMLAADLGGGGGASGVTSIARVRALLAAHRVRVEGEHDPVTLVGVAYVLEGATQGGIALAKDLHRTAAAGGFGTSFLGGTDPRALRDQWLAFAARLDTLGLTSDEEARACEAAVRLFRHVHGIVSVLHPIRWAEDAELLRELNPEAGLHPVVAGERALEAALVAGERSWAAFPYYEARYGERGRGFTRSDSAWLASLASLPPERATEQVVWLSRLLAARGMPQWLMESHLRFLHQELTRAEPDGAWDRLLQAAEALAALRREVLADRVIEEAKGTFQKRLGGDPQAGPPESGALLAAAVADEALGIERAVPSLTQWLLDPERFPETWVSEGERLLAELRSACSGAG